MLPKIVLFCLIVTALGVPIQDVENPAEYYQKKFDSIVQLNNDYNDGFAQDVIAYHRHAANISTNAHVKPVPKLEDLSFISKFLLKKKNLTVEYSSKLEAYKLLGSVLNKLTTKNLNSSFLIDHRINALNLNIIQFEINVTQAIYDMFDSRNIHTASDSNGNASLAIRKLRECEDNLKSLKKDEDRINSKIDMYEYQEADDEERKQLELRRNKMVDIFSDVNSWYRLLLRVVYWESDAITRKDLFQTLLDAYGLKVEDDEEARPEYYLNKLEFVRQLLIKSDDVYRDNLVDSESLYQKKVEENGVTDSFLQYLYEERYVDFSGFATEYRERQFIYETLLSAFHKLLTALEDISDGSMNKTLLTYSKMSYLKQKIFDFRFNTTRATYHVFDPKNNHKLEEASKEFINELGDLDSQYKVVRDDAKELGREMESFISEKSIGATDKALIENEKKKLDEILKETDELYTQKRQLIYSKLEPTTKSSVKL